MKVIIAIAALVALFCLYLLLGMTFQFIVAWAPLLISLFTGIILWAVWGGDGLSAAILLLVAGIISTSSWQGSQACLRLEELLGRLFGFLKD
jgi:hypothetical protein